MRLIFIDESGDPGNPATGSTSKHFVIAALVVSERDWLFLKEELNKIKSAARVSTLAEVKWLHCMQPTSAVVDPKRPNPLQHLADPEREKFALDVLNVVRRLTDCRLVSAEIDKLRAFSRPDITSSDHIYNQASLLTMERVQYYLKAKDSRGIVIQDSRNYQQDKRFRSFYGSLISRGSYWTQFPNVIEGVFLSPSDYSTGLQVVDFCVGAIAKNSPLARKQDGRFFAEIRNKFTTGVRDGVTRGGLKHWP